MANFEAFLKTINLTSHPKFLRRDHVIFCLLRNSLDGVLVLGGSDPSLYEGQISYVDLNKPANFYNVSVGVGVGDQPNLVCKEDECIAIIDTGSSSMTAPLSKVAVICASIDGTVSWYFLIVYII